MGLKRYFKSIVNRSDELIGKWSHWAGDDGGMGMFFDYGLVFKKWGLGTSYYYDLNDEQENDRSSIQESFKWERLGKSKIRLRKLKESTWTTINYKLWEHKGGYDGKYLKLVERNKEEFWNCSSPLFKFKGN